ncbi:MAG: SAM-dependent methyltransferase [Burkholderiales bacterium]
MGDPVAAIGRLYLVPNTLDMGTWRDADAPPDLQTVLPLGVLHVAAGLRYWVAENAKSARSLLKRVNQTVPLSGALQEIDIRELPRPPKGRANSADPGDLRPFLAPALAGADIGLVSEAGLPAVADPGAALVRAAHALRVPVVALSGPSSLMLALAASGLNGQSFAFVGYLPTDAAARAQRVRELEASSRRLQQTQLVIETPYRNQALLQALVATLAPQTWLSVSSGLTLSQGVTRTEQVTAWRQATFALASDVPAVFSFLA